MAQTTLSNPVPAATSAPKAGENTWLWLLKLATGPFILILIVVHFIVNHLAEGGLLTYRGIVNYYQAAIVPIMEGCFLALVIGHSLLGLRSILLDLNPSRSLMKVLDWVFLIGGIGIFIYGIWLIQVIVSRGIGG